MLSARGGVRRRKTPTRRAHAQGDRARACGPCSKPCRTNADRSARCSNTPWLSSTCRVLVLRPRRCAMRWRGSRSFSITRSRAALSRPICVSRWRWKASSQVGKVRSCARCRVRQWDPTGRASPEVLRERRRCGSSPSERTRVPSHGCSVRGQRLRPLAIRAAAAVAPSMAAAVLPPPWPARPSAPRLAHSPAAAGGWRSVVRNCVWSWSAAGRHGSRT